MILTKAQEAVFKKYAKTPVGEQALLHQKNLDKPGIFWFLPVLAWIEPKHVPYLMLTGNLIRIQNRDYRHTAAWHIPLTGPNYEKALMLLTTLGWDGYVWPRDPVWPTGAPEETGLKNLLGQIPLGNTFSFPCDPVKGNRVCKLVIPKTTPVQPMPLDVPADDLIVPTEEQRAAFYTLVSSPETFMPSDWSGKPRKIDGMDDRQS